jgi:hypothetical protein
MSHVSGGARVEVPIGGARRLCRRADCGQCLVERIPVAEGAAGLLLGLIGHHGLLWLKRWVRSENAGSWCPELSRPGLNIACPQVVDRGRLWTRAAIATVATVFARRVATTAPASASIPGSTVVGSTIATRAIGIVGVGGAVLITGGVVAG